jgi:hypothetical protein
MKRCPHCNTRVNLYIGKYRCGECHLWLEQEECLEVETVSLPMELAWLTMTQKAQRKLVPLYVQNSELDDDNQTRSNCRWRT